MLTTEFFSFEQKGKNDKTRNLQKIEQFVYRIFHKHRSLPVLINSKVKKRIEHFGWICNHAAKEKNSFLLFLIL